MLGNGAFKSKKQHWPFLKVLSPCRRGLLTAAWPDGAVHICEHICSCPNQPDACWVPRSLHWAAAVVKSVTAAKDWSVFPAQVSFGSP